MPEPILDPAYWERRLKRAKQLHHSIYLCPHDEWLAIEERHRQILASIVQPQDAILDIGCGYGRLLTLLPSHWQGKYLGVDLSPDLIALAKATHKDRDFVVADARTLQCDVFDLAVLISIRPMLKRNCTEDVWTAMEQRVHSCAKKVLYLEYDRNDEGSLE